MVGPKRPAKAAASSSVAAPDEKAYEDAANQISSVMGIDEKHAAGVLAILRSLPEEQQASMLTILKGVMEQLPEGSMDELRSLPPEERFSAFMEQFIPLVPAVSAEEMKSVPHILETIMDLSDTDAKSYVNSLLATGLPIAPLVSPSTVDSSAVGASYSATTGPIPSSTSLSVATLSSASFDSSSAHSTHSTAASAAVSSTSDTTSSGEGPI